MMTPSDYLNLWETCRVTSNPRQIRELDYICKIAFANQDLYQAVQLGTRDFYGLSVPWPIVAALHFRESNQDFTKHLHNGDPLVRRTIHVPEGRPSSGEPPFTWSESAIDSFRDLVCPLIWDIPSCLRFMERYNGLGYQRHGINSPYLWDYTDKYTSGLFVADGVFDPNKKEARPGCVAILKSFAAKGVSLDFTALGSGSNPTMH